MSRSSMTDERKKHGRSILDRLPAGTGAIVVAVTGAALVVGGLVALRDPVTPSRYAVGVRAPTGNSNAQANLSRELARCRTVTETSTDPVCHAAWEAHRRRFFGHGTPTQSQER